MVQGIYTIASNKKIARDVYEMVLSGDTSALTAPGQFLNIKIEGYFLRRPISVCDWDGDTITIVYKVVGSGTAAMSEMAAGQTLDVLAGLGNGFDMRKSGGTPLLVGGGVGSPPMAGLCRRLVAEGKSPTVVLGFASREDVFYEDKFRSLGAEVRIATADGSYGVHGFVTDAMAGITPSYFYACGPIPMLRAVSDALPADGQLSFEERMGCGFGACMGCSCQTKYGNKRICRDGPVLTKGEVIW